VSPAVGDTAQLLDIQMHQVPGCGALVAARHRPAHRQASVLVQMTQQGHSVPAQHCLHRRTPQMKMRRNTVRPPLAAKPHLDDAPLAPLRQPIGAAMGQLERSIMADWPPARYRSAHFLAVATHIADAETHFEGSVVIAPLPPQRQ